MPEIGVLGDKKLHKIGLIMYDCRNQYNAGEKVMAYKRFDKTPVDQGKVNSRSQGAAFCGNAGDFECNLFEFLTRPSNQIVKTKRDRGKYCRISYAFDPVEDQEGWQLCVHGERVESAIGLSRSSEILRIGIAPSESGVPSQIVSVQVLQQEYPLTAENIYRAVMVATILVSRIDLQEYPDVCKILRLYRFQSILNG